jgi:hypothetical protein
VDASSWKVAYIICDNVTVAVMMTTEGHQQVKILCKCISGDQKTIKAARKAAADSI